MSRIEDIYDSNALGKVYCDIRDHLPFLRESAKGNVFEIGVRGGASTSALVLGVKEHGGHVWSLDIADCRPFEDPAWTFTKGHSIGDSARMLEILPRPLDLFFLDADHGYPSTLDELHIYAPLVRKGGLVVLHDTDLQGAGVRQSLEEYAADLGKTPTYHSGSFGLGVLQP